MKNKMLWTILVLVSVAMAFAGQAFAECKVGATEKRAGKGIVCPAYVVLEDAVDKDNSNLLAIYYTTTGQDPVAGKDRVYKDPILVNSTTTLKFMGVCEESETEIVSMIVRVKTKDLTDEEKEERALLCRPCNSAVKPAAPAAPAKAAKTETSPAVIEKKDVLDEHGNKITDLGKVVGNNAQVLKQHLEDKGSHVGQKVIGDGVYPTLVAQKCGEKRDVYDPASKVKTTFTDCSEATEFVPASVEEVASVEELAKTMWCHQTWWKGLICYGGLAIATGGLGVLVADAFGAFDSGDKRTTPVLLGNTK